MFLVKPLEPVKVKKKISEPVVKDTKPKKDKDGIEAVDYDEVKTEIKEVDSDFSRAVVLKLPYEYTHPYSDEKIQQMPIKVGEIVMHQFQFVVDVMKDQDDTRDVLINKLFRFKLKNRFKDNKNKPLSPYEKDNKH